MHFELCQIASPRGWKSLCYSLSTICMLRLKPLCESLFIVFLTGFLVSCAVAMVMTFPSVLTVNECSNIKLLIMKSGVLHSLRQNPLQGIYCNLCNSPTLWPSVQTKTNITAVTPETRSLNAESTVASSGELKLWYWWQMLYKVNYPMSSGTVPLNSIVTQRDEKKTQL